MKRRIINKPKEWLDSSHSFGLFLFLKGGIEYRRPRKLVLNIVSGIRSNFFVIESRVGICHCSPDIACIFILDIVCHLIMPGCPCRQICWVSNVTKVGSLIVATDPLPPLLLVNVHNITGDSGTLCLVCIY